MYLLWIDILKERRNLAMNVVKFISIIIISIGVMFVFDARLIAKKRFGAGDQNEATKTLKISGFVISIIGGLIFIIL